MKALLLLLLFLPFAVLPQDDVSYLWHITDTHVDPAYVEGSSIAKDCEGSEPSPTDPAPKYGCHECDTPYILLESAINFMHDVRSDNVAVLWTGDDLSHFHNTKPDDRNYVLDAMRNTTNLLVDQFGTAIFPVLGNHDTHPEGQLGPGPNWLLNNATVMFATPGLLNDTQVETFQHGGYYAADLPKTDGKCQLITYFTTPYYSPNKLAPKTGDTDGQLAWLKGVLQEARSQGRKALLSGHIPVGGTFSGGYSYQTWHSVEFSAIIEEYYDVIVGQVLGHLHADEFKMFRHGLIAETPISVQYCGQAVTPRAVRNPGLRLFAYNTTSCELLDYTQYYFPINDSAPATQPMWKPLYSAKDEFGLADMSPAAWDGFIDRLIKEEDTWANYYALYHSSRIGELPLAECKFGSTCHKRYICSLSHVSDAGFHACWATA